MCVVAAGCDVAVGCVVPVVGVAWGCADGVCPVAPGCVVFVACVGGIGCVVAFGCDAGVVPAPLAAAFGLVVFTTILHLAAVADAVEVPSVVVRVLKAVDVNAGEFAPVPVR